MLASTRIFAVVGLFASLLQVAGIVPGLPEAIQRWWGPALLAVAVGAALAGGVRLFQPSRVSFKAKGVDLLIEVKVGDLFEQVGNVAVPVNDFFDTILGQPVEPNSVHGQFLEHVFPHDEPRARREIDAALAGKRVREDVARGIGAKRRFDVGETAVIKSQGHKFVLVALSTTDAATCEARASPVQLVTALVSLWSQVRACCNHEPISVPLIGAGASRTGFSKAALLDFLLSTAIKAHKETPIAQKLTIILTERDLGEIDLFDVERRYR